MVNVSPVFKKSEKYDAANYRPVFAHMHLLQTLEHLFVCIVALRPKSTAMVIVGRSVHLTTLFPGQA